MSVTKLSRLGSVLLTVLLLAVVGFAYNQNHKTNELMESNISIAAPARDALGKVDSLVADSAFQFVQFLNLDPIRIEDVTELLNQLVRTEEFLIAAMSRSESRGYLRPNYAKKAAAAFRSYLDEQENDPASDTTISLQSQVGTAIGDLRSALSRAPDELLVSDSRELASEFRRFKNLFSSTEIAVERYFNRTPVYLTDILNPIDRSLKVIRQVRIDVANPDAHANHSASLHAYLEMLNLQKAMDSVRQPIERYRASLFAYGDAVESEMDGTALNEVRDVAREAMHAARRHVLRTTADLDKKLDRYQAKLLQEGVHSQRIFIILAVIGIIAAVATTLLIQQRISARLGIIAQSAQRISRGDLDFRIAVIDSDGLGDLAIEFNRMAEDLQSRDRLLSQQMEQIHRAQQDLGVSNRELENRVEIRTAELADSEQRLHRLIESYVSGIYIHREFKPIYANQTLLDMFGFDDLDDFLALQSTETMLSPEERERIWGYHQARLRDEDAPPDFDFWALKKNGERFCVNNRSFVVNWDGQKAVCTTLYDLTEKREAERSLAEQQNLMNALLQNTHEGFWFIDLDGKTTDINPAMTRILDRPRQEILGKTILDFVDEENSKILRHQLELRKIGVSSAFEIELQRPDGANIPCLNNATPLFTPDGERIGSVGIWSDISGIKETQRSLEREKERAEAANIAKSEFLATISHEIRTPMNGVLGMAGLLLKTGLAPKQKHYAERIKQSGQALLGLLNNILDVSKIEAGQVELEVTEFDLSHLIQEVGALMESQANEKGLAYESSISAGTSPYSKVIRGASDRYCSTLSVMLSNSPRKVAFSSKCPQAIWRIITAGFALRCVTRVSASRPRNRN